jgi:hypothetical protein
MPDMVPVATMIKPPDPNQGLATLSSILGIRQAQQNLQTGALQQQGVAADVQQQQQKNRELQAAQQLSIQGVKGGQYTKEDGSLDRIKLSNDIAAIGPYAQTMAGQMLSQANEVVSNQQAHQNLTVSRKKEMGDTFASLAADPQVDNTKVIDAIEKLRQAHKDDPEYSRLLTSQIMHFPNQATPDQQRQILGRWSAAATGEPQATPNAIDTGTQIQPGAVNRFTGAQTPAGEPIDKQQVITTKAGPQAVATPARGTLAPLKTTQGPELNTTNVQQQTAEATAQGVTGRVQQAQAAANNTVQAQDALSRARTIMDTDSLNTGGGFKWKQDVNNMLAGAGIDTKGAEDMNSLVKNLARYEASRATQSGLGHTDAARELAHNGSPNVALDKSALKGIITQSLATEKALAAYANIQSKTQDPSTLVQNETRFRNIPNLIQGYEYGLARNPQEAEEFLKKHGLTRAQMTETRRQIKAFENP